MKLITSKTKFQGLLKHETKKQSLKKFIALVAIIISYFIFMSLKFGTRDGILTTILTWSFFVFCTPIADAGFLLAFPVRIITGIKMMYTQLFLYVIVFMINFYTFFHSSSIYDKTIILKLFYNILSKPYPFWGIILISFIGTILSIYFGDEMINVSKHNQRKKYHKHINKYKIIIFIFLIIFTIMLYYFLLEQLHIKMPV